VAAPLLVEQLLSGAEEAAARLEELAGEAERLEAVAADTQEERQELDERADELSRRAAELEAERDRLTAAAAELGRERRTIEEARAALEQRAHALDEREAAFDSRWRWLLRLLTWRPRLSGTEARVVEFLFVPTSDGYRLLEQEGIALRRGSRLTGLLAEERAFVVTKIAPWSFDGRWCAYLQQEQLQPTREEGSA
jgi:predicted RNase H-like nuclease (RuvC/YqgF family)